jgi:hypothetical protein
MVLVTRILIMSKSGFEDVVLIKLIVGVVKHVTIPISPTNEDTEVPQTSTRPSI